MRIWACAEYRTGTRRSSCAGKSWKETERTRPNWKRGGIIADILGLSVETESGEVLGTVKDVAPLSSEVYTIEREGKEILFPAVKGVVKQVDLKNGRIIVDKKRFDEVAVF